MRSSRKPPRSFGARAQKKKKKVQAGCIYASNHIIPFVEIRGGSIPTGACVAYLPACIIITTPWHVHSRPPLRFRSEIHKGRKKKRKEKNGRFFEVKEK